MAIAERVNRRLLSFLDLWERGTQLLFLFGTVCALVTAVLHYTFFEQRFPTVQAVLLALLFAGSRVILLIFTGITHCLDQPLTARLNRLFLAFAVLLSALSAAMSIMLIFQNPEYPPTFGDTFANGHFLLVVLAVVLELCLFAGFWLPIVLHGPEIRSILEHKRAEEEAVIRYIYELRAQRLREGRIELASGNLLIRLRTLFLQKKDQLKNEHNQ